MNLNNKEILMITCLDQFILPIMIFNSLPRTLGLMKQQCMMLTLYLSTQQMETINYLMLVQLLELAMLNFQVNQRQIKTYLVIVGRHLPVPAQT
jgi:hypothetical protein